MAIPITCDGIKYDSIKSAAKAFDISENVVTSRINQLGWSIKKALTKTVRDTGRKKTLGWARKRVFVRKGKGSAKEYPSILAAIEALKLQKYAHRIYDRIRNGEKVQKAFDTAHEDHNRNIMTVTINKKIVHFESMAKACQKLKLNYSLVRRRIQRGWTDEEALGLSPRKTKRKPHPNARPIKFIHNEITYKFDSFAEACKHFAQNPSSVRHRIDDLGWAYQNAFLLEPHPSMSQKIFGYIYLITDLTNSKKYVGQTQQTIQERFRVHLKSATLGKPSNSKSSIQCAIASKGIKSFTVKQIDTASTLASLNKKERHYIKELDTYSPNGYNLKKGGAGTNKGIQYIVEGELFPSISAVARRYNKTPRTVNHLLNHRSFTIEQALGLEDTPIPSNKKPLVIFIGKSVMHFKTIADAAKHFRKSYPIVCDRIRRKWSPEEALDIKKRKRKSGSKNVIVFIDGVKTVFSSQTEAAKAHNINLMLFSTRIATYKWTVEEALEIVPRKKPAIDTLINGKKVVFNTLKEAAEAYKIKPGTLGKRIKNGYTIEEALNLKDKPRNHPGMKKIELKIKGIIKNFVSYAEAERYLGLTIGTISNRLENAWTLAQAAELTPRPNNFGQSKPVEFKHNRKHYKFESESIAAKEFGVDRRKFNNLLSQGFSFKQALGLEQHKRIPNSPRPVTGVYEGKLVSYPNMTIASNITGINMRTIRARIIRNTSQENIFIHPRA
jgi:group I intron endonuclease